jgi:DnaJ-class molecular chaperone
LSNDVKAKIATFVDRAFENLEQVDYYQVLGVSSAVSAEQIRQAYYRLAAYLHPDVHGLEIEPVYHSKLTAVFSRVVEAYKVLSDESRRRSYDGLLARGDMRMRSGTKPPPMRPADQLTNPKAKRFYELSQRALGDSDVKSARTNLKLALSMEPDSKLLQEALAKLEKM